MQKLDEQSDEELMVAYQLGEYEAFEILYKRYSRKMYGYLKLKMNRGEDVEEVMQMTFAKLHGARSQYSPQYKFAQWLFVIQRTVLMDFWRKKGRQSETLKAFSTAQKIQNTSSGGSKNEDVLISMDNLSDEQRKIVELRVIDELSYKEISEKIGRPETAIRKIVSRTLESLRQTKFKEGK